MIASNCYGFPCTGLSEFEAALCISDLEVRWCWSS